MVHIAIFPTYDDLYIICVFLGRQTPLVYLYDLHGLQIIMLPGWKPRDLHDDL